MVPQVQPCLSHFAAARSGGVAAGGIGDSLLVKEPGLVTLSASLGRFSGPIGANADGDIGL